MSLRERIKKIICFSWPDTLLSIALFVATCLLCALLHFVVHVGGDIYSPMLFVLAVALISCWTTGYFYGALAAVVSVFCVNYFFTYPYVAFNFNLSGYPIAFISMFTVSIIICTMTSRLKEQETLRELAAKEKMRGNLLRAVSHDLRTPLTSILGVSSAILENDDYISPQRRRELLTDVKEDAEWLIRMVENLLSITRIGEGNTKIDKQLEAAEEIVAAAVEKFRKRVPDCPVAVQVPGELLLVPMDAILIEQVIANLLENAHKHAYGFTKILLSVERAENNAVFEVRDDGCGIAPGKLETLFTGYFEQTAAQKADQGRDMGIGLSVCMTIVQAHGGDMRAYNLKEGGAAFRFTLPLKEDPIEQ